MIYIDIASGEFLQGQLCLSVIIQDSLMLNEAGKWGLKLWEEMNLLLLKIIQPLFTQAWCDSPIQVFQMLLTFFVSFWAPYSVQEISHQHYCIFAIRTILYVAGNLVEKHQTSMKVTDVLLNRKPEWNLEDTVVFPCLKLKHELLLSRTVYFAFVFLHGCWNETIKHEWNRYYPLLGMDNVIFNTLKLITTACLQYALLYYKATLFLLSLGLNCCSFNLIFQVMLKERKQKAWWAHRLFN